MRTINLFAVSVLVLSLLPFSFPGPVAVQVLPPPPQSGTPESQPGIAQVSPSGSGHSGAFALTDSPLSNYAPNVDVSARIATTFNLQGASSASLAFWHRYYLGSASAVLPHSGNYALTDSPYGDYSNSVDISAKISQPFNFSSAANPHLTFWHYYALESGYDYLRVEVSTDGNTWTTLTSYNGYQSSYIQADLNLTSYVGQPAVYLRFHLHTDGSVTKDGWVMDDLLLKDGTTTLFSDSFESGTGAWVLDAPWGAVGSTADRATVQVSTDGGATWSDLASYQGTQASYIQASINLSAYLGQPSVRFRWRLATDSANEYDGWYLDDILVTVSGSQVFSDGFESGTGNWILDSPWGTTLQSTTAYITSISSGMTTVADDLTELRNRGAIPDYDVFNENNINDLWMHLDQYRAILMEEDIVYEWSNPCNPSCENPIPVTGVGLSIYNHRQQLGQWIYNGGGLFSTDQNDVSGSSDMYWAWLPGELQVKSKEIRDGSSASNLYVAYDPGLFSYPNVIGVTRVSSAEAHGEFVDFPGYTAMVRDRVTNDVLEIYRYYGAGAIVLSHLEYETANYDCGGGRTCDANYVENELHFLRVSVNTNAIYPNSNGKLDIFATATSSALGTLTPSNTQSATYDIRNAANISTGITGTLSYDDTEARWEAINIDISSLVSGTYSVLVTFMDQQGNSGSGAASFRKGLPSGKLGFSTPNARNGDAVFVYATLWDAQGTHITNSVQLTATLTGITSSFRLYDDGSHGDLRAQDGEYGVWQAVSGSGDLRAVLYYQGDAVDQASLTVINDPDLIVLTDIEDLYNDTGTDAQEDQNGNHVVDFYDLLARLNRYAAAHRGIVYDLSHEITIANGYANDYGTLDYGGSNNNTNRFQMGRLIDRLVEQVDQDTQQNGQHIIKAIALIGDDEVVPFYRRDDPVNEERKYGYGDNPTMIDSAADFLMTDVPYATFSDADPANDDQPRPDIPVGRVFAERPRQLIAMVDAYDTRIRLGDDISNASLFHLDKDTIDWPWFGDNVQVPVLSAHYQVGNINNAPPFAAGQFYRYNGNVVDWTPISVTNALPATNLTLLYSHASHYGNTTQSGIDLNAAAYDAAADSAENVLVNGGCHSGFSVSHNSPSNSFRDFNDAMVNSILDKRVVYFAPSTYGWYQHHANQLTPLLTQAFVDRVLNATTPTIGDAWVRAYGDYWVATGNGGAHRTTVAYGTVLYGLPTQAIEHVQGTTTVQHTAASLSISTGAEVQVTRTSTISIDIPNFTVDFDAQGAALVQAGNGGTTFAEPYGPIMPQILQRFVLPDAATNITIVENQVNRVSQLYGVVNLQTSTPVNTQNPPVSGSFPITSTYPAQSFWYSSATYQDGILVTLSVIPAQYQPNHELTLFTHMEFVVTYALPVPSVSINNVVINAGQPVKIGQTSLPMSVTVTTAQARSLNLEFEVVDPAGVAIDSGSVLIPVLAGTSEIGVNADSSSWTPGPKILWVSIGDENMVFDSRVVPLNTLGIRVQASVADPLVNPGTAVPLTVTVRDENGALVGGLAGRIAVSLDGASVQPTISEVTNGVYRTDLGTAGLALGMHQTVVQATDLRNISSQDFVEFAVGRREFKVMLPLILRQ